MPTQDELLLARIRKLLEQKASTDFDLTPWQENLLRNTTVPSTKSLQASEVLSGFSGSWAASFKYGMGATTNPDTTAPLASKVKDARLSDIDFPSPTRAISSKLGLAGFPEINFVPYNWGTHRFGGKGPSLVGHPISFSVIGPTLKSPAMNWQWDVTDNSGIPGVGDVLTMADRLAPKSVADLTEAYNLTGSISDYNGGLYLVISDDGSRDNSLAPGATGLVPLSKYASSSRHEIFRVIDFDIVAGTLTLDPGKRLSDFFTISPVSPALRAITLFKPYVTRLSAVPTLGGDAGREQTFVVVAPEVSANDDLYPPFGAAAGAPNGTWRRGGFEPTNTPGEVLAYGGGVALPIPIPIRSVGTGRVEQAAGSAGADGPGLWRITDIPPSFGASGLDQGLIVRIFGLDGIDNAEPSLGTNAATQGWFEILEVIGSSTYQLKRIPEINPSTGEPFFGPGPFFDTSSASATAEIQVRFTLHNPISKLWEGHHKTDDVEASRLTNLIDPTWVERSNKLDSSVGLPVGATADRADRAIFDTVSVTPIGFPTQYADPGNMMDLGFRMVLFPAKDSGGNAVPDFDNPIPSRDVVIDPSITDESQSVTIDYSSGTVILSHAPPASAGGQVVPNGIVGTGSNNPRGEVVLFAACVPYSMEEGQLGPAVRITGGDLISFDEGYSNPIQQDVFGAKVFASVSSFGASVTDDITLTGPLPSGFPPTGFVEIVFGDTPFGLSQGTFGYSSIDPSGANPVLKGIYTDVTVLPTLPASAVVRKELDVDHRLDVTYGSKWRTPALRFGAASFEIGLDGSIIVNPQGVGGLAEELRAHAPYGTSSEVARLYLESNTNRWTTSAPPWATTTDENEVGIEITRGRLVTSMALDFDVGLLSYSRFLNTGLGVTRNAGATASALTPVSNYTIELNTPNGLSDVPGNLVGLSVAIEGTTIVSAEESSWTGPLGVGQRLLVNVKAFGNRTVVGSDEDLWRGDEGPANPVDWFAYTAVGGDTPTDIATAINAYFGSLASDRATEPAEVSGTAPDERVLLTGRQISILPARPYIQSADVTGGITLDGDCSIVLSVFSADPRDSRRERWVTAQAFPGGLVSNDANAISDFLNAVFYDTGHAKYAGTAIENAGFFPTDPVSITSLNPYLSTLGGAPGVGERQFLFIGPNDPRHPDGTNTVCLLCGGFGSVDPTDDSARNFFNVMVEVGKVDASVSSRDVATVLGGEFSPSPYSPPRCGLFFGTSSVSGTTPPSLVLGSFNDNSVGGTAHGNLGWPKSGVAPLGLYCGSFPIDGVSTNLGGNVELTFRLPTGMADPFYSGPQVNPLNVQDTLIPTLAGVQDKFNIFPYLGRWTWGGFDLAVVDTSVPSSAGVADIWISYGNRPHNETGFRSPLRSSVQSGYEGFVAKVTATGTDLDSPLVAPGSIDSGDMVTATHASSGDAFHGIVLNWGTTEGSVLFTSRGAFSTLGRGVIAQGGQPTRFGGRFSAITNPSETGIRTSIIPNPNGITLSSALRTLYPHEFGVSTNGVADLGEGIDGGSSKTDLTLTKSNAIVMGGGRINLLSLIGANAPAGLSFSSPVVGADLLPDYRLATTFIDHGVFSTSVTLSRNPLLGLRGANLDSAGIFDVGTDDSEFLVPHKGTGISQFGGAHQVGGVGGLRISGDAQVWLTNLRMLGSDKITALVREFLSYGSSVFWNKVETGPVTVLGQNLGSGHIPSGFGSSRTDDPLVVDSTYYLQEATVSVALTRADLYAFAVAAGVPHIWPGVADSTYTGTDGEAVFRVGQVAIDGSSDIPLKSLAGLYLKLGANVGAGTSSINTGVWRIVGTPMITLGSTKAFLGSGFPSYALLQEGAGDISQIESRNQGHIQAAAAVAVLQLRVDRFAQVPSDAGILSDAFVPESSVGVPTPQGHTWSFTFDEEGLQPVYVADVVDPGGSPTGVPSSIRGLSLVPGPDLVDGSSTIPMDLISVFSTTDSTDAWPLTGPARLLGIHESVNHRGEITSHAFFTSSAAIPTSFPVQAYARAIIYSSQRSDRLDEVSATTTRGEFSMDRSGRVRFEGYPSRLGPGILMDGGLGMVQATAFRSTPRPVTTETVGSLTIYGQDTAYPLPNYLGPSINTGPSLPSTFNNVEFYDDITVVGPRGVLMFEDGLAAKGLPALLRMNVVAAKTFASPYRLDSAYTNTGVTTDVLPLEVVPNDALFPFTCAGIKFRSPGGLVYERAYRSIDASGGPQGKASFTGASEHHGIRGLEIPAHGECLLCPKGPPTLAGEGVADFNIGGTGNTPLDLPLYEFNGEQGTLSTGSFAIRCGTLFSPGGSAPSGYEATAPLNHRYAPGSLQRSYRHSASRENTTTYPVNGTAEQVRLLDGMVLEDITNGTFYTIGDVGRWKAFPSAGTPTITTDLNQPGDAAGTRSCVNGSLVVAGSDQEILYDLSPYCDPLTDPLAATAAGRQNGFGDRVDDEAVRRPHKGHRFRITPNVEFVPVLGPRGVDGGLIPPFTDITDPATAIPDVDAIFYSEGYDFVAPGTGSGPGDVGRFLYICGTDTYQYTGWWVIVDVIESYTIQTTPALLTADVAVLRKWRRDADRSGSSTTQGDAVPLTNRTPMVRMASDRRSNDDLFTGIAGEYDDLTLEITKSDGTAGYTTTVTSATLSGAGVVSTTTLATHLNANLATNGSDASVALGFTGAPVAFITWVADAGTVVGYYDLSLLSVTDKSLVVGHGAMLRVSFLSNNTGTHAGSLGGEFGLGFHTFTGVSSEIDRGAGDRNNAAPLRDAYANAASSAADGIRWVFSAPLTEENIGSYIHLTKPNIHRFGLELTSQVNGAGVDSGSWATGWPRSGDGFDLRTDIYRINRDPTTTDILLGGDCELYHPEIISVGSTADLPLGGGDLGKGRPILYSPLSVMGNWPDDTGNLPSSSGLTTDHLNQPILYSIQPVARERIVSISPAKGRSNPMLAHGDNVSGPKGVGPKVAGITAGTEQAFDVSEPWQLMSRLDVMHTGVTAGSVESQFNADPLLNYVWAPAGEWWQVWFPAVGAMPEDSQPPPTLRFDLTDAFTQAMQPGAGINSPYPGHQPKGVRLNRIWVNFGVWGNALGGRPMSNLPGFQATGNVLDALYMCFNLVLEIPGSRSREAGTVSGTTIIHPKGNGTGGLPFGGRAPYASYNHGDNTSSRFPGGTIVVPLYCNREAGDLMPNVMERWVTGGPAQTGVDSDWAMGDYEFGFGCSSAGVGALPSANFLDLYNADNFAPNAHNPVLWGGMDYQATVFGSTTASLAAASVFPRLSRVSGGYRAAFSSGLVPSGTSFEGAAPDSINAATMTGLVITHAGEFPERPDYDAGTDGSGTRSPTSSGHAFTMALTPVGDALDTTVTGLIQRHGRTLEVPATNRPQDRPFKVGNWLDKILDRYGIPTPSGSMLPPGARVFLEVTASPGPGLVAYTGAGAWIAAPKLSLEVETADGTAYTSNVNILGEEG